LTLKAVVVTLGVAVRVWVDRLGGYALGWLGGGLGCRLGCRLGCGYGFGCRLLRFGLGWIVVAANKVAIVVAANKVVIVAPDILRLALGRGRGASLLGACAFLRRG
jgi:hypothetical protein